MLSYVGYIFICFSPMNGSCMIVTGPQLFTSQDMCKAVVESVVDEYAGTGKLNRVEGFCKEVEPAGEDL